MRLAPAKWRKLLWLAVAIGCVLLFVREPGPEHHRLWRRFWDSGHLWLFASMGYLIGQRWLRRHPWHRFMLVLPATALIGWLIEVLQYYTGRDYAWRDVGADTVGMAFGLLCAQWRMLQQPRLLFTATAAIVAALMLALLLPIGGAAIDAVLAARAFPVLADFATAAPALQRERFSPIAAQLQPERDSLRVALQPAPYSGFFLDDFPTDWRGQRWLHVELDNPGPSQVMTCRLHDAAHERGGYRFSDRYNARFALRPGRNHWRIDLAQARQTRGGRVLDLGDLRGFGCFVSGVGVSQRLYLRRIWLQPGG